MPQSVAEWQSFLVDPAYTPTRDSDVGLTVAVCVESSANGGSGAFLAVASDGNRYWVKSRENLQGPQVCYTELAVARLGTLVDAPVCDVRLIRIPEEFEGWEFRPGHHLRSGIASASLDIPGVVEERQLMYRPDDDNCRRHVGVLALAAWLGGGDQQWLYAAPDNRTFSHDHGHYLPGGSGWTPASLLESIVDPPALPGAIPHGHAMLDVARIEHTYDTLLNHVSKHDIAKAVSSFAGSWGISLEHRATLAYYADSRRELAAVQLEQVKLGAP